MGHSSLRFLLNSFCNKTQLKLFFATVIYVVILVSTRGVFFSCCRAAFAPLEESKVVSSHPFMFNARQVLRAAIFAVLLSLFAASHVTFAQAQNFTLTPSALTPSAGVDPGGSATGTIALSTTTGFASPVALSCTVTSSQGLSNPPLCLVSPMSATPDATLSLTLTTVGSTPAGQYTITISGTSGSETETAILFLNVVDVPQDYTLTVSKTISPTTVTAGSGAEATVTVTPIASYTGTVTLSCFSVTPVVVAAPICAFSPATVAVTNGTAPTSVLTISTYGTAQNIGKRRTSPRILYAFWLALPALAFVGAGASRVRRKKLMGMLLLMAVAGGLLFLPSCSATKANSNNANGLVTPKNTYTFTLTGVDANGVAPSNSTSTTAQATVSLTVN